MHRPVVTSSLYVHNLLNQVRHDDSIMNDAVWLPKANDYESDSKSWMMIGHLWIHVASTFKNVKVIVDVKVVFVVNIVIVVKRNLMFFFSMEFNPIRNTNVVLYTHHRTKTWLNNDVHLICRTRRILRNL